MASYHRAAALNPITSISAYKRTGSSNVDGIYVTYSIGDYDTIGSMDAVENGALIAALNITVGDRAKQLWVWVDEATTAIQALHINMVSGAKLAASQSRPFDQAALAVTSASGLGSGLLLGLAEAVKPGSGALSALSFSFLKTPTSTGVAVDMPAIDLIAAKFAPAFNSKSSITMSGGGSQVGGAPQLCWPWNQQWPMKARSAATAAYDSCALLQATCPDYSTTISSKTIYTKATDARRLKQVIDALGSADSSQTVELEASLQYAATQTIPSSTKTRTDLWTGQVYDLFADSAQITSEAGVSQTIAAPKISFTIPSGQKATCVFVYSVMNLDIPYTVTSTHYFDDAGDTSWNVSVRGRYQVRQVTRPAWPGICSTRGQAPDAACALAHLQVTSNTNMETVITFTSAAAGAKAGEAGWGQVVVAVPLFENLATSWRLLGPAKAAATMPLPSLAGKCGAQMANQPPFDRSRAAGVQGQLLQPGAARGLALKRRNAQAAAGAKQRPLLRLLQPAVELLQSGAHQASHQACQQIPQGHLHLCQRAGVWCQAAAQGATA